MGDARLIKNNIVCVFKDATLESLVGPDSSCPS